MVTSWERFGHIIIWYAMVTWLNIFFLNPTLTFMERLMLGEGKNLAKFAPLLIAQYQILSIEECWPILRWNEDLVCRNPRGFRVAQYIQK